MQLEARQGMAQPQDTSVRHLLGEVQIRAYEQDEERFAAMPRALVDTDLVQNGQPQSVVPALNAIAGVRMEERSPSSYRLHVRGSSMRAPFGVRNVKVYYKGLPFTDPGGTSYVNQLGPDEWAGAEIVKGPAGSMYGAGTGGLVMLGNTPSPQSGLQAGYSFGSYRSHHSFAAGELVRANTTQRLSLQYSASEGYRDQSASERGLLSWSIDSRRISERLRLSGALLAGTLFYETPGGLTRAEYTEQPRASRPAAAGFPGAAQANASIRQRMLWSGVSIHARISDFISNRTGVYFAHISSGNAAIRNYAETVQPYGGVRSVFHAELGKGPLLSLWDAGLEWQTGTSSVGVFDNNGGNKAAQRSQESVRNGQGFLFLQTRLRCGSWELAAGASINSVAIRYRRSLPDAAGPFTRSFDGIIAPRFSLAKVLPAHFTAFVAVAEGFSPPATDELLPSGSAWNGGLQPERGRNYEAGIRYSLHDRLYFSVNAYYFRVYEAIVQRRDAGGGDVYINAGRTRQPGLELSGYRLWGMADGLSCRTQFSYAFQPYTYQQFERDGRDFSGNRLPGIPRHNVYAGALLRYRSLLMVQVWYFFNSRQALNDANDVWGAEQHQLSIKAGRELRLKHAGFTLYAGVNNLLNSRFSLGYDINAAGGRYYNAAPLRNYYVQIRADIGRRRDM